MPSHFPYEDTSEYYEQQAAEADRQEPPATLPEPDTVLTNRELTLILVVCAVLGFLAFLFLPQLTIYGNPVSRWAVWAVVSGVSAMVGLVGAEYFARRHR